MKQQQRRFSGNQVSQPVEQEPFYHHQSCNPTPGIHGSKQTKKDKIICCNCLNSGNNLYGCSNGIKREEARVEGFPITTNIKTEAIFYYPIVGIKSDNKKSEDHSHGAKNQRDHPLHQRDNNNYCQAQQTNNRQFVPPSSQRTKVPMHKVRKPNIQYQIPYQQCARCSQQANQLSQRYSCTPSFHKAKVTPLKLSYPKVIKCCKMCQDQIFEAGYLTEQQTDSGQKETNKCPSLRNNKGIPTNCHRFQTKTFSDEETQLSSYGLRTQRVTYHDYQQDNNKIRQNKSSDRFRGEQLGSYSPRKYCQDRSENIWLKDSQYYRNLINHQIYKQLRIQEKQRSQLTHNEPPIIPQPHKPLKRTHRIYQELFTFKQKSYQPCNKLSLPDHAQYFSKAEQCNKQRLQHTSRLKRAKSAQLILIQRRISQLKVQNQRLRQ